MMKQTARLLALSALAFSLPAMAAEQPVTGAAPTWVKQVAAPVAVASDAQPLRLLLQDQQLRFHGEVSSLYQHRIWRIDAPAGVAALEQLALSWQAQSDQLTIHSFRLTRKGRSHDVLPAIAQVLDMQDVPHSALTMDGRRSLGLPLGGLMVGDEVELAWSIDRSEPLLNGHRDLALEAGEADVVSLSATWDGAMGVEAKGLPAPVQQGAGEAHWLVQGGARTRAQLRFSDFGQWSDVAGLMVPLFASARVLNEDSPLHEEIARIRAASADPMVRAQMALALVKGKTRYLYSGLGDAPLRPMRADQVWGRGFADCKGRAALLLALLDGLDVVAEPALVAMQGGAALDRHLPSLSGFDHVIVRAQIGGRVLWLDPAKGAEAVKGNLAYGWALPLRLGAGLEAVSPKRAAVSGSAALHP
jgi:hypothetical protein